MGDRILPHREGKRSLAPGFSQLHWMRLAQSSANLAGHTPRKAIPMEEIALHASEDDAWTVLDKKVYNITPYLRYHPGGVEMLMMAAGKDGTALFNQYHAWVNGHSMLQKCFLGNILETVTAQTCREIDSAALSTSEWRAFRLMSKESIANETYRLIFELPKSKTLGLQFPGEYLCLRFSLHGKRMERYLTPTSRYSQQNSFELIVKLYAEGAFGQFLERMAVDTKVEMRGPESSVIYSSPGTVKRDTKVIQSDVEQILLLAAGSGITPMLQMLRYVFENAENQNVSVVLLNCHRCLGEIIALDRIEPLANMFPSRIRVVHVLSYTGIAFDQAEQAQCQRRLRCFVQGRLDKAILKEHAPLNSRNLAVFQCGPTAFNCETASLLKELGVDSARIHAF